MTASLDTNDLIHVLSRVAWRRVKHGDRCPECGGEGEIECEYCGSECECKRCKGVGEVNIRIKEFSLPESMEDYEIRIGPLVFRADRLQAIALAAQMLQAERITYRYHKEGEGALFGFAGLDILLMPVCVDRANTEIELNPVSNYL
jgi:RecJ-like exonuclease